MAESGGDRYLPCLFDRLLDDGPRNLGESRRSVVSLPRYRENVVRDIRALLNARAGFGLGTDERERLGLEDAEAERAYLRRTFPEVWRSTLNYGLRDGTGQGVAGTRVAELENSLREAITIFEPRLAPRTLHVQASASQEGVQVGELAFEIRADLRAEEILEHLFIRTKLDVETGECDLSAR